MLGHISNADQTPVYFNVNINVERKGMKTVQIIGMFNE
jgi:hypothetical protein